MNFAKNVARRLLPPSLIATIKQILGNGTNPDEIALVRRAFGGMKNGVMIDVGAHHGNAALPFLRDGWVVTAFEPDNINRKQLLLWRNSFPKLLIDARAIGDHEDAECQFFRSDISNGISSLLPFHDSHSLAYSVGMTTLDAIIDQYGIDFIDFLKIDVEGCDLLALKGLSREIPVRAVMVEFEDRKTRLLNYTATDLAEEMMARGLTVVASIWNPIVQYGRRHSWNRFAPYPCAIDENCWGNLIGFSRADDAARFWKAADAHTRRMKRRSVH